MSIETPPRVSRRLDNIQALRGIAAMAVVVYHLADFLRAGVFAGQSGFPAGPWDQGWAGVDLFFVISGFIMVWTTQSLSRGPRTSLSFLWRRIIRIYPLWWVCAGVMAAYFIVTYAMPAAPDRVAGTDEAWGYALRSFALWPQDSPPLLGLGWTLIHEMWFYLVFALILTLPRRSLSVMLGIWAVATVVHYVGFGAVEREQAIRKLVTSPLNLEFIGGAVAALLLHAFSRLSTIQVKLILGLAVLWLGLALSFNIRFDAAEHHFMRFIVYGLAMIVIVWSTTRLAVTDGLSVPDALIRLGDWSYALYLSHYIVLITMRRVVGTFDMEVGAGVSMLLFSLVFIGLSLVSAWALHRLVERPVARWLRPDRSPAQTSG